MGYDIISNTLGYFLPLAVSDVIFCAKLIGLFYLCLLRQSEGKLQNCSPLIYFGSTQSIWTQTRIGETLFQLLIQTIARQTHHCYATLSEIGWKMVAVHVLRLPWVCLYKWNRAPSKCASFRLSTLLIVCPTFRGVRDVYSLDMTTFIFVGISELSEFSTSCPVCSKEYEPLCHRTKCVCYNWTPLEQN